MSDAENSPRQVDLREDAYSTEVGTKFYYDRSMRIALSVLKLIDCEMELELELMATLAKRKVWDTPHSVDQIKEGFYPQYCRDYYPELKRLISFNIEKYSEQLSHPRGYELFLANKDCLLQHENCNECSGNNR